MLRLPGRAGGGVDVRFVVPGPPTPWKRTQGSGANRYTDPTDRSWRDVLSWTLLQDTRGARAHMDGEPPR